MNASEQLRKLLDAAHGSDSTGYLDLNAEGCKIATVLPLVADVVEAAEQHIDIDEFPEDESKITALRDALAKS